MLPKEKFDFTPAQLIRAVKQDFANMLDAAAKLPDNKLRTSLRAKISQSADDLEKVLTRKTDELEGRPIVDDNLAADSGWRALGRIALKMPYLAWMGMVTASSLPDLAGLVFAGGVRPKAFAYFGRGVAGMFAKVPQWGLEAVEVAFDESAMRRIFSMADMTLPMDPRMARTRIGRAISGLDRATDQMSRMLATASGMNRWNVNLRRMTAHLVMNNIVRHGRKMELAGKLMKKKGISQEAALKMARLDPRDAARMSKWGLNSQRSGELLDILQDHATDKAGNRIANVRKHTGQFNPEYYAWDKGNKEIFDLFVGAINAEVKDIIVDPKLLSRPLGNQKFIGRMFNQFWSFAYAWSNQTAVLGSTRTGVEQVAYIPLALALGATADAIHHHLRGSQTFAESAEAWADPNKVLAKIYAAAHRANLFGWISRPLSLADQTGIGIGSLLGEGTSTLHSRRPEMSFVGTIGPFADYWDRVFQRVLTPLANFEAPDAHTIRRLGPFGNLLPAAAIQRFTSDLGLDNPLGEGKGLDLHILPTKPGFEARK